MTNNNQENILDFEDDKPLVSTTGKVFVEEKSQAKSLTKNEDIFANGEPAIEAICGDMKPYEGKGLDGAPVHKVIFNFKDMDDRNISVFVKQDSKLLPQFTERFTAGKHV
jgi:hypothetical protein